MILIAGPLFVQAQIVKFANGASRWTSLRSLTPAGHGTISFSGTSEWRYLQPRVPVIAAFRPVILRALVRIPNAGHLLDILDAVLGRNAQA